MSSTSALHPSRLLGALESLFTSIFLPPNMKLKVKTIPKPNFYFVVILLGISGYCIFSGIFYDIINNPPSIGQERV